MLSFRTPLIARALLVAGFCSAATTEVASDTGASQAAAQAPADPGQLRISCTSKAGERQQCPADTSKGVALVRSRGDAPCLLGKTWGYDDEGVWVAVAPGIGVDRDLSDL